MAKIKISYSYSTTKDFTSWWFMRKIKSWENEGIKKQSEGDFFYLFYIYNVIYILLESHLKKKKKKKKKKNNQPVIRTIYLLTTMIPLIQEKKFKQIT